MSERLIKIATPKEVYKFAVEFHQFGKAVKNLREEGFNVERMNHYLLHWSDQLRLGYKGFFTHIVGRGGSSGSCDGERGEKALEELKERGAAYRMPYFPEPYFALTSPKRYEIVAGVFQDLGWQVERLLAKK